MEEKQTRQSSFGWIILGAAIGASVVGLLALKARQESGLEWDADRLVDACDKAAEKLDLFAQNHRQAEAS